ncbi:MAG: hypothetical protein ACRC5M_06600 [Anaeroplasmataceae bacterium]
MSIKTLAKLSMLTVILFAQEAILQVIPSVQLSFLLIIVYATTLPKLHTLLILIVYVILDNLLMGSTGFTTFIPMIIGWFLVAFSTYLVRNKHYLIITMVGTISVLFYTLPYAFVTSIFYDIKLRDYLISDIPFTVVLILSTSISLILLYPICRKTILKLNEEKNI